MTLHSPDLEFDDSIKTLDYTNVLFKKVGFSLKSSKVGWMYLDFAKQAMDYLGNKGEGLKRHNINVLHGNSYYGEDNWLDNRLGVWNDIDVYNANSVTKDDDDGNHDANEPRYQNSFIKHDYFIYPFQRKYLNNYMGNLSIQMYKKGTDPEYSIVESSVINEKIVAYKRCGSKTIYDLNQTEFERNNPNAEHKLYDIQIKAPNPCAYICTGNHCKLIL